LLETDEIIVRADRRITIPLRQVKSLDTAGGALHIKWDAHEASLHLGDATAKKWLEKIRNPKSRLDKLGIKPGQRVSVIGVDDTNIIGELAERGADISARPRKASDAIFFGANDNTDLARIEKLKESLAPAGALWVIRPKGTKAITEAATMAAGRAAGLIDVKVVKFSETHTAEKFMIPVEAR
jgi:hypothetical protein